MTKKLLALLAALFLLLGACGSGGSDDEADDADTEESDNDSSSDTTDEDSSDTADEEVDIDDWVDDADEICAEFNEDSEAFDEMFADLDEGDFEGLADVLEEAIPALEDQVEQFQDLGVPDESADEVEEVLGLLEDQVDLAEDLQQAAEDEDEDAFEDIAADADENEQDLNALAEELGLEECGDEGSTTSTTEDEDSDVTVMEDESEAGGMGGNGVIDGALLEADIEDEYFAQLALVIDVSCPIDRPLVSGDVFECDGIDEDLDLITFEVTQLDANGNVVYEVVAINGESL
jgi:hypothetical protein